MTDREKRYLAQLAREYPTPQTASAEIINLTAILNLPKGTEHFMSDIHGENEAFSHILNNGSGAVANKVKQALGDSLTSAERRNLATLIYYPREKLIEAKAHEGDMDDWYRVTLRRLIKVSRIAASKYSRSKVRKALPKDFEYIFEEMLNTSTSSNKEKYYENIINAIIATGSAETFIMEFAKFIKRMTVDQLHIVGDIFDRGPHADDILDRLMAHHNVDIQWGNHDVLWMGAAAGNMACIATAVKNCVQYDNLDMLENAYGINLLPLALFSSDTYKGDCSVFKPRKISEDLFSPVDPDLSSKIHKAISVIMYKLEGQLVRRRPEYHMEDRDMFSRVDFSSGTIEINGEKYPLRDVDFPTVDAKDPTRLTPSEEALTEQLALAFRHSEKLQTHIKFLLRAGSLYKCCNGNLLYHGCVPCNADGSFMEFDCQGEKLSGRAYFDYADRLARQGYFAPDGSDEKLAGEDFLWFLWCGRNSPVFGRDHIATFERALIEDKAVWKEPKNAYYEYYEDSAFCERILSGFSLDKPWSKIVNGHIPVKAKAGENPVKADGRLVVIDGGFCRAYQKETGIAGYTMFFNSVGMHMAAHEAFTTKRDAIENSRDITSHTFRVDEFQHRVMVADIDTGADIQSRIGDLMTLLEAYRNGTIKPDPYRLTKRR